MSKNAINERFINSVNRVLSEFKTENKGTIATKLKIKKAKFSEILNSRMNVGIEEIVIFSEQYGYNIEWLITGKGEIKRNEYQQIETPIQKVEEPFENINEQYEKMFEINEAEKIPLYNKIIELQEEKIQQLKEDLKKCKDEKKLIQNFK